MQNPIAKYPIGSLILISVLSGIIWRYEIEHHGWRGLIWLSYFHYAVPLCFGIFILWANFHVEVNRKKRILLNFTAVIFGILLYYLLVKSLTFNFAAGVSWIMIMMNHSDLEITFFRSAIFIIIPLIPVGTYFILRTFKIIPPLRMLFISILVIILSIPVSNLILDVINHVGGGNFIHSIKSGMLIPFWVLSVGLLFISTDHKK